MPELPEVETIARALRNPIDLPFQDQKAHTVQPGVVGRVVREVEVLWQRSIAIPRAEAFEQEIKGQRVEGVSRRGKFIVIKLSNSNLLFHLRMSGDLIVEPGDSARNPKHDRVKLHFSDGTRLVFNDPRKFGRAWLVDDPEKVTGKLGIEPLSEELDAERFFSMLRKSKRKIKPLLLDQTFLSGMGNIYTDEALYMARIHPGTNANLIDAVDAAALLSAVREVLCEGIKRNGASIDWVYRGGDFQNHFQVYQKEGQLCPRCGSTIQRTVMGQRGTHFCPSCQTLKS